MARVQKIMIIWVNHRIIKKGVEMKYLVSVPTTCSQVYEVEATTEEEAKDKVLEGEAEMIRVDYDENNDKNTFEVETI
jgi:hypothetical protein